MRQRLPELRGVREGLPHCALVLDAKLVPTVRRTHRVSRLALIPDAPAIGSWQRQIELPDALRAELTQLGLL